MYRVGEEVADWLAEHGAEAVVILEVDAKRQQYYVQAQDESCRWVPFDSMDPRHDKGQSVA